jgi:hypothetical protein
MRKLIIASLVLGLLPITSAPANAGVYTCKLRQEKNYTSSGIKYVNVKRCIYSSKGKSY